MSLANVAELKSQLTDKIKETNEAREAGNLEESEKRLIEAEAIQTQIDIAERTKKLQTDHANQDGLADDVAGSVGARTGEKPQIFSMRNLILSERSPGNTDLQKKAEFERTLISESGLVARDGGTPIPMRYLVSEEFGRRRRISEEISSERAITSGDPNAVATDIAIDQYAKWLSDTAPVMEFVEMVPGLSGNFDIPLITSKATNTGAAAEGTEPTEGEPTFGKMSLTPHQIQGEIKFSNQSLIQTEGYIERTIRENLADSVAEDLATYVFVGTGASNQPTGVRVTTGVNAVTYSAANLGRWDELSDARWAVDDANIPAIRRGYFCNSSILKAAERKTRDAGSGIFVYQDGMIGGTPAYPSGLLPANDGVYAEWSEVFVGMWDGEGAGSEIIVDRITSKGNTIIALIIYADVGVRRVKGISKLDQS